MIMMIPDDYRIIFEDMPPRGAGFVREDPDGYYTIVLNSRLSYERQVEAAKHELRHIDHDDLERSIAADQIENQAHSKGRNQK